MTTAIISFLAGAFIGTMLTLFVQICLVMRRTNDYHDNIDDCD